MISESDFDELAIMVGELHREVAQLRKWISAGLTIGPVTDVDAEKGFRVALSETDDEGNPKKSNWMPHPEHGGEARSWAPLSVGQVIAFLSPPGDTRMGYLLRAGFSSQYPPPSKRLDQYLWEYPDSRVTMRKDELRSQSTDLNMRAEEKVAVMGKDEVKIQAKDTAYILHTDKDGFMLARRSILIQSPSVTIRLSDPGAIPDVVEKEENADG